MAIEFIFTIKVLLEANQLQSLDVLEIIISYFADSFSYCPTYIRNSLSR